MVVHVLDKFAYCPACGSKHFEVKTEKSKQCENCGFEYFLNPSAATAAFIRNAQGQLLVTRRKNEPGKGTLDLPGGFSDIGETLEECLRREVKEETGLTITTARLITTLPNKYRYSGFDVPTLDAFFECSVDNDSVLTANDDASEAMWLSLDDIHTEQFGLRSVRQALHDYLEANRQTDTFPQYL